MKKLHWTQRPENHDRLLAVLSKAKHAKATKRTTPRRRVVASTEAAISERYDMLVEEARQRFAEINAQLDALKEEAAALANLFPVLVQVDERRVSGE